MGRRRGSDRASQGAVLAGHSPVPLVDTFQRAFARSKRPATGSAHLYMWADQLS